MSDACLASTQIMCNWGPPSKVILIRNIISQQIMAFIIIIMASAILYLSATIG